MHKGDFVAQGGCTRGISLHRMVAQGGFRCTGWLHKGDFVAQGGCTRGISLHRMVAQGRKRPYKIVWAILGSCAV